MNKARRTKYHISLNVNVTPELIKALDKIVAADGREVIDYYKLPKKDFFDEVTNRLDPITIYTYDRNPRIEQAIVTAVAPYARSGASGLGTSIGPGVEVCIETTDITGKSVGYTAACKIKQILSAGIKR